MKQDIEKPYILHVAEIIYKEIYNLKKKNNVNNIEAFELFIESEIYEKISSGKFHDEWFSILKKNNFIDKKTNKKIPSETIRLLEIQKDSMVKQLIKYPELYYAKSKFPLEISQRAFAVFKILRNQLNLHDHAQQIAVVFAGETHHLCA